MQSVDGTTRKVSISRPEDRSDDGDRFHGRPTRGIPPIGGFQSFMETGTRDWQIQTIDLLKDLAEAIPCSHCLARPKCYSCTDV